MGRRDNIESMKIKVLTAEVEYNVIQTKRSFISDRLTSWIENACGSCFDSINLTTLDIN